MTDTMDDMAIASLKGSPTFAGDFGVSLVQQAFKWGYNRARRARDRARAYGIIQTSERDPYLMRFR